MQEITGSFVWLAITTGAFSLLTPCVFPMVPITVSYFTQHSGADRKAALRNAVIFSLGIIATFTALGFTLAAVVGATGINKFAANPWVNILITLIFLGFAFNLLGAYEIRVPYGFLNKLDALTRNQASSGTIGALLMGLTFTLTSFTCTAPFIGTLLVLASQGSLAKPLVGMLAFSTVFALPFFVLALVPQWMARLPKAGGWLNSVKVVMGFLEIAAAMKFISNVDLIWKWNIFTHDVVVASWMAIAFFIAFYLLGKIRMPHDTPVEHLSPIRVIVSVLFMATGIWLATGLGGKSLGELESFLPPRADMVVRNDDAPVNELVWITNNLDSARAVAKAENKLVFIDFTGYTCTNCRWMEANMFTRPEIKKEMSKFVLARLYTDGEGDMYENQQAYQQEKFGTVALPFYAVIDAGANIKKTFPGLTRNPEEFIAFLQQSRGGI